MLSVTYLTAKYIWKILVYNLISLNSFCFAKILFFYIFRLCSALLFKVHSKDEIKAVIHYVE